MAKKFLLTISERPFKGEHKRIYTGKSSFLSKERIVQAIEYEFQAENNVAYLRKETSYGIQKIWSDHCRPDR